MLKRILFITVLLIAIVGSNFAQERNENREYSITGSVLEQKTGKPIEFATILLHSADDNKQLTGGVTDATGHFSIDGLKPGTYYLKVSYIGFEILQSKKYTLDKSPVVDAGKIYLVPKDIGMKDVVVTAEKVPISYQIDKKVINVAESFSSISGTAVEVLENVPSVTVDIDGNVSLRGSGNFQVLIDGRPSILSSSDALQQIPASSIENIEIITNPSAKYDPDGTAGIINVILKKNNNWGMSGLANLNAGIGDKYGSDGTVSFRNNSLEVNLGLNYDRRRMKGDNNERNWTLTNSQTSYYNSIGTSSNQREFYGVRGSVSFDLGDEKLLSIGGRYNKMTGNENGSQDYAEWTSISPANNSYLSSTREGRSHSDFTAFANYKHPFDKNGHELYAEVYLSGENSDDFSSNSLFDKTTTIDGKITTESGPASEFRGKIDYTLPLGGSAKFEAGYKGETEDETDNTELSSLNAVSMQYETNPLYSHELNFFSGEHSLYSIYTNKISGLGFKLGVRAENTTRDVEVKGQSPSFHMNTWEYFPSAHFSYELSAGNQVMVSYTKRINRPRGWDLEPNLVWEDAYNMRIGNPSLLPELIDSYELGYQTLIGSSLFSVDTYYRMTKDKIDRVRSVYSDKITLQTSQNVGKDYSLGAELFFNFDPIKEWNINLMGNLYNYKIEGALGTTPFSRESFNWSARFNNSVKLMTTTQLQINLQYNSPTVSSQGRMEGFISTNVAVKHELFNKMLTAILQIRDLFGSAKYEFTNESADFYSYRYSKRESPVVMLNLRFNFNNHKDNGGDEGEGGQGGGEEE